MSLSYANTDLIGVTMLALQYDPTIRGVLIFLASVIVLPGSVYLLLATNVGARLGFMVAMAGLLGWMTILSVVWTVYALAQGPRGRSPEWKIEEVITGNISAQNTVEAVEGFPLGWKQLSPGDKALGDAQAAADHLLAPAPVTTSGHGEAEEEAEPPPSQPRFTSPFTKPSDYVQIGGYEIGGEDYFPGGIEHDRGFLHKPHYAIIRVQPVLKVDPVPGQPPAPARPDVFEPVTTVVMVRDLGTVRLPGFVLTLLFGLLFGWVCYLLHRRDLQIMAQRRSAESDAGATDIPGAGAPASA